jgi:carbon-monoxide dehydrogenase large subunit
MAGSILGASVKRVEDPRFITGAGTYLSNRHVEGALWMAPVRSTEPHARLLAVDVDEAASAEGVVGVYTAADFPDARMPVDAPGTPPETRRPLIASERVRYVGEIVAVVVARSERAARDAAAAVWPDYEPLPVVATPEDGLAPGAPLLFPELGSNVVYDKGDELTDEALAGAEIIIETRVAHQRVAAVPLETGNALAVPRPDGGVDIWLGAQSVHGPRWALAKVLGLDESSVHVMVPDMGGGFGAKIPIYPEHALVAAIALELGRSVRWNQTRSESLQAMSHGRAQAQEVRLGATRDGIITGLQIRALQDAGAYPLFGANLPSFTRRVASGPYHIPRIEFRWRSVVTNKTPVHAYRGAGRPEATMTLERALDQLARELGMDPAEVRRRNFIPPEAFPYMSATGERYDSGEYGTALDLALETAGYRDLRAEQARRRARGDHRQLGIGIASYIEITAGIGRMDWGAVEVNPDGTVTVYSGALSHGHGHETTFAQLASQVLGLPMDRITYVQADSDVVVRGGGTMGSRSMQIAGSAVARAARGVVDKARAIVAHHYEAAMADTVVSDDGSILIAGVPGTAMTLGEIAVLASDTSNLPEGMNAGLRADDLIEQVEATVPFGTHVSVVEVDVETGDVHVLRHVACDDCGTIFNRMVVDGQVHGGVAQGIGQALYEAVRYDADGRLLSSNLTSYLVPTATTVPSIEIRHTETPTDQNELGAKGIGEAGTIGSTPAVVNAVIDALAHLGVRHLDMPLTPDRVWEAIHSSQRIPSARAGDVR